MPSSSSRCRSSVGLIAAVLLGAAPVTLTGGSAVAHAAGPPVGRRRARAAAEEKAAATRDPGNPRSRTGRTTPQQLRRQRRRTAETQPRSNKWRTVARASATAVGAPPRATPAALLGVAWRSPSAEVRTATAEGPRVRVSTPPLVLGPWPLGRPCADGSAGRSEPILVFSPSFSRGPGQRAPAVRRGGQAGGGQFRPVALFN